MAWQGNGMGVTLEQHDMCELAFRGCRIFVEREMLKCWGGRIRREGSRSRVDWSVTKKNVATEIFL
jgi:hypothetical protein